jgi:hypothetical protein
MISPADSHGAAAAAGGMRSLALGSVAAGYVLSVVAMIYFLCRRVMWRKEQYGLRYQPAQVGAGAGPGCTGRGSWWCCWLRVSTVCHYCVLVLCVSTVC